MGHIARVYVAGAYSTSNCTQKKRNIDRAWEYSAKVAAAGAMPYSPITNTAWLDQYQAVGWWYEATAQMLDVCDAILLMPGWRESKGAVGEYERAKAAGLLVIDGDAYVTDVFGDCHIIAAIKNLVTECAQDS